MTVDKNEKIEPIISWILGMVLCSLGIAFSVRSKFGVSTIEAPVYALHLKISQFFAWYSYGMSEYVLQAVILIIMCLTLRKFKWKYLLSFGTAFLLGELINGWNLLINLLPITTLTYRIIYAVLGCVIVSFSIANYFRTWLPPQVWELFVKEVSEKFNINITKFKWFFDFSLFTLGIIFMLVFFDFGELLKGEVIGIGTIVTTFVNAPLIGFFSKLLDKIWKTKKK